MKGNSRISRGVVTVVMAAAVVVFESSLVIYRGLMVLRVPLGLLVIAYEKHLLALEMRRVITALGDSARVFVVRQLLLVFRLVTRNDELKV